ncbi:MAG TPA: hypothetical protein VKA46_29535 [Gemmataceae bacterium]|nr:hypothetical protein [Gemmataceae bacterium]
MATCTSPALDSPTLAADRAGTPAGTSGAQTAQGALSSLVPGSNQGSLSDRSAAGLLDSTLTDEESPVSGLATASFSVGLTDDAA